MSPTKPNVVFLVFDSLRYDFLSCSAAETNAPAMEIETPAFDRLVDRGTRFANAYSAAPRTTQSHAAMFTGQYPSEIGIVGGDALLDSAPVLTETFASEGYDTLGIAGPSKIRADLGFDRGFDDYLQPYLRGENYLSKDYLKTALSDPLRRMPLIKDFLHTAIKGLDDRTLFRFALLQSYCERVLSEPFFMFTNFTTVHWPWDPPRTFKEEATPSINRPRIFALEYLFDYQESLNRDDVRDQRVYHTLGPNTTSQYRADSDWLTETELDVLRRWYAGEVKYADYRLSQFLDHLESNGLFEDTLFVITSDHGDYIGEHGQMAHGKTLYDEVVHVPLIFSGPGVPEGAVREDVVSLVDLFDTICGLLDFDAPVDTSGVDLFDSRRSAPVFSEHGIASSNLEGDRHEGIKHLSEEQLIDFCQGRKVARTDEYMYEITSTGEKNLYRRMAEANGKIDGYEEIRDRLHTAIAETLTTEFKAQSGPDPDELDRDIRRNLEELGYL